MIDFATVLSKGGLVLWSWTGSELKGNPIGALVRSVLLEERGAEKSFQFDRYTLKWTFINDFDLVVIVVYQSLFQLLHVEEILEIMKSKFVQKFSANLKNKTELGGIDFSSFTSEYHNIVRAVELRRDEQKSAKILHIKQYEKKDKKKKKNNNNNNDTQDKHKGDNEEENEDDSPNSDHVQQDEQVNDSYSDDEKGDDKKLEEGEKYKNRDISKKKGTPSKEDKIKSNIEKLKSGKLHPSAIKTKSRKGNQAENKNTIFSNTTNASSTPPKKSNTTWDVGKFSEADASLLNRNKSEKGDEVDRFMQQFLPEQNKMVDLEWDVEKEKFDPNEYISEKSSSSQSGSNSGGGGGSSSSSGIFSFFSSLTSGRTLTKEDLSPVLDNFKQSLMSKNVAAEIAEKICESVGASLIGKNVGTFTSITTTVYNAIEEALTRILTPKRKIDVLREAMAARDQNRPYVIVMVGVNGVGKSTSLSKITYWLTQNNFSVMIAACDTFRSGAIEQLQVHAKCLKVPLYQKGYQKDPSIISKEAIQYAKKNQIDVVMVDTAGRMQDNEPLMRSLCKVIEVNNPDLVLFVGEALVGNDGVDQLNKFNDSLINLSTSGETKTSKKHLIDGIVLTKFDTIDDKVGAAISMVYSTGHPIVFVGVGQTYPDLKTLSVKAVVRSLLK